MKILDKNQKQTKAGHKYLTFKLGEEEYGLEILKVREIIGMMSITKIPRAPEFVKGVINLRGKVNPVIDTRLKFGMGAVPDTEKTCIIIVDSAREGDTVEMGIIVDSVSEVMDISGSEIEEAPEFGNGVDTEFIMGMAKTETGVKILLDIDKVLTYSSIRTLKEIEIG